MMPWSAASLIIRASAGYGKTETLCLRLLAMMLNDPDILREIVALTFTRAAAAEIYDRLLELICKALTEENGVGKLRGRIAASVGGNAADALTEEHLRELLRKLVDAMGELEISTIDSFFYRLVCAYAIELGLPGRAELVSEGDNATADALLREALHARDGGGDAFLDACRESRHGEEKKSFFSSCVDLLTAIGKYEKYRDDENFWGGKFAEKTFASKAELEAAFRNCENYDWRGETPPKKTKKTDSGEEKDPKEVYREKLSWVFAECAKASDVNCRFSAKAVETLRRFLKVLDNFPAKKPDRLSQGWHYDGVEKDVKLLVGNAGKVLLAQCAIRSRGLGKLLKAYRAIYDREMPRKGRINFSDLPRLLGTGALNEAVINEIQYRVNSRFKHFLIDEFQDTSRLQWNVLDPCIGDNGGGDHSLFIVGDVKQAIYGWREGDSKLMGEIADDRSRAMPVTDLPYSYRYGKNICAVLNRLFRPENLARFPMLPGKVREQWSRRDPKNKETIFLRHKPAENTAPGEFRVFALAPVPEDSEETFADRAAVLILDWLRDPKHDFFGGNSFSVGVLVRSNKDGIDLRDSLIRLDPAHAERFVWESDENIVSDPLVAALIAFGVAVQFPGETLAAETVGMHPLLRELVSEREKWLDILGEAGVSGLLQAVLKDLRARAESRSGGEPVEPPVDGNIDTLLAVAREFDAVTDVCDMRRFRDRALLAKKPAAPAEGKLRILTVHHSKGLTFNVVFYPMFDNRLHGNWLKPDLKGAVSGPDWMLYSPRDEGMRDTDVAAAVKQREEDFRFEELCLLYVALTRANRGMYVLLPPRTKEKLKCFHPDWHPGFTTRMRFTESTSVDSYYLSDMVFENFFSFDARFAPDPDKPKPLRQQRVFVEVPGEDGQPVKYPEGGVVCIVKGRGAFEPPDKKTEPRAGTLRIDWSQAAKTPPRPRRITPSHLTDGGTDTKRLYFSLPDPDKGAELGTRLHELFATIARWSDFELPPETGGVLRAHFDACKANREVTTLFDEECELWRERLFDVILPDGEGGKAVVTGCFDRVQIYRRGGKIEKACIIDFKSNDTTPKELDELCDHYRGQLELYRAALAKLLGIPQDVIECKLLFTKLGALKTIFELIS